MLRSCAVGLAAAVVGLMMLTSWRAADEDKTHDGVVVSATAGKLVMTDKEGKNEQTHTVNAACTVTLDGKAAKLVDLKKGDAVQVTVSEGAATKIVATRAADKPS